VGIPDAMELLLFSRYVLAWELKRYDTDSLIDVVQQAIDVTAMSDVRVKDCTSLHSDNGSGYVSRACGDYLRLAGIKHLLPSPLHPQTTSKEVRCQQTPKTAINKIPVEQHHKAMEKTCSKSPRLSYHQWLYRRV